MTASNSTNNGPRVALVTGANQGLGRAVVEGLADGMHEGNIVLLTSRNAERVAAAVDEIGARTATVEGHVLDVTDTAAVDAFAAQVQARFGGIDIVVSNATSHTTPHKPPTEQIDPLVETSNRATHRMLRAFEPILRPGGRFLVVASTFGTLGQLDDRVKPLIAQARSLEDLDVVLEDWVASVHDGSNVAKGWPEWANIPSKVEQVAAMRLVAAPRRERDLADGTLVAAVCPGLIDTPASRPWFVDMSGAQTPAEAARALLELLLGPVHPEHHGELVRFGRVLPWLGIAPGSPERVA